jgi:hypothetical protein
MAMTTAQALLADLASRGIELKTDSCRLRWRPAFMAVGALAERIISHRAELIALLTGPDPLRRCAKCRWPLDSGQRCVKCCDRHCVECGKLTGSMFVERCVLCGHHV